MSPADLKELLDRRANALGRRPAFARVSGHARARLLPGDDLACDVELEDRSGRVDQSSDEGGAATGPHPAQLMRASLAASLAMGCRAWGARLGIVVDAVEVVLTCDSDARGPLGVSADVAVGWSLVHFDVTVTSAAADEDVRRVVQTAWRLSPMLANLAPTVQRVHRLTIVRPSPEPAATERPVPSGVTPWFSNERPQDQHKQRK